MSFYVKILPEHTGDPRWVDAGPDAFTVHLWAVMYCNQQLTDGRIPYTMAERVALPVPVERTHDAIKELVSAGLWEDEGDAYVIADYFSYALEASEIRATRARWSADKRWRRKHKVGNHDECPPEKCTAARQMSHWDSTRDSNRDSYRESDSESPPLDQTRQDQTHKGSGVGDVDAGPRSAGATRGPRPAVGEGDQDCPHLHDGLVLVDGRLRCTECHNEAFRQTDGDGLITPDLLLRRARDWPEPTVDEEYAWRDRDPYGWDHSFAIADSVADHYNLTDTDRRNLVTPAAWSIYHRINPEVARLHEYRPSDDGGTCARCQLPEPNAVHITTANEETGA